MSLIWGLHNSNERNLADWKA